MLLPLLTIAGLFLSSRCSQYGCLDNPDNCLKPEYHCHDDKATGQCIKAQVNTRWPDSLIEEPLFEDTFIEGSPSKKSRLSTDNLKGWHKMVTMLFDELQTYFSRHGLLLSDLTNNQMARLSEAVAQVIYKEIKIERESADMERLLQIILDSKNLLLSHGVSFDQLNSKQLDELSSAIIRAYFQGGKNQDDTAKESQLRRYNIERKAVHSYTMSNDDLSASQRNIDNTLDAGPSNTVQNTEKQHKDNGLASGSNKTSLLGQTGDSENSFQELKEERQADVSSIKNSLQKQQKDDPVKFKFSTEEKQLQAEAKRDDGQDQINVALAQGMPFIKKEPITQEDVYIIIIVVVVVAIILVVVISTVCYCMKSLERRKKLIGASDQSNDDDYQELCRQHYASKAAEQKDLASRPQRQERNDSTASTPTLVFSPAAHQRNHLNTNKASRNSSLSSWSEEPVTTTLDISTGHAVLSYMEDHMKNKNRLSVEWLALCKYQAENVSSSVGHVNMIRNRAPHILPYDHNRVKLGNTYQQESDYINASFIIDNDPRFPMYIATQGPLPSTIHHFWQMVWEQGSVAIVMLAPISEDGVAQCARYWPDEGSSVYDGFEIHLVSEHIWCEDYLVRSLYLKNLKTCETRTITQFHFLSWPRNGVPFSPRPLLELRRKVSKCFRGSNSPIVVHCSDGFGRSGTYILIDLVISRMLKGVKEMDIAATLEHLRDQRAGMVTSKDQMEFALCSVAEEVNAILKVLLH